MSANLRNCISCLLPLLFMVLLLPCFSTAQPVSTTYTPDWESLDKRPTPEWWTDAKFGIFIHWGVYSVPGYTAKGNYAEWYLNSLTNNAHDGKVREFHHINYGDRNYYDLADDFNAELFNPDEWAKMFENAGAKYMVLTSKHHDGFCLWPSQEAGKTWGFPWSADVRGPNRDLVGDLFKAVQKTQVKPGLYFSLYEWYNPLWTFDPGRFAADHSMPQLYDLVQQYQPWVVWADGDWDASPETWQSQQFLSWLYNESQIKDKVVVNDRWGSGTRFKHGGVYTPEYQPDMEFEDHAWEESRGMGASYGYNRAEDIQDYNSSQALVLHLIDKVSRGGNFLLDIGPDGHGQIPPIMQERLADIGKWLNINGEAIYNTRRWRITNQWSTGNRNFKPELIDGWKTGGDVLLKQTIDPEPGFAVKEVFYTFNPKTKSLYAIFPKYPDNKKLVLKGINLPPNTEVSMLATKEKLKWENSMATKVLSVDRPGDDYRDPKTPKTTATLDGQDLVITLPEFKPAMLKTSNAYVVKIANYGAYVAKPKIEVKYDPKTMAPSVVMSTPTQGGIIRYTVDGSEPKESSPEYKQPLLPKSACTVRAKVYKTGLLESNGATATVKILTLQPSLSMYRAPEPGLRMELVTARGKYTAASVADGLVDKSADVFDFTLDPICVAGTCGTVWKGFINIPTTTGYQFWTNSDDGSILYIDNQVIVNNDGEHGATEETGMAYLQQGWHQVKLVYFNSGGPGSLQVAYSPLGASKREIPGDMFAH